MDDSLRDRVATAAAWAAAVLVGLVLTWLLFDLARRGLPAWSLELVVASPRDAGRAGGIAPILVSTALILLTCLAAVVPVGLGTAVLLSEVLSEDRLITRVSRRSLDLLAGVPSIVFGLFGNAFFCVALGLGFSILSGGLTLAVMVLPLFARASEEALRSVGRRDRLAAAALGLSRTRTLWSVLLPRALPALIAALVLSLGRAAAETAALVFTSGYVARMPSSLFDSGRALSVHVLDLALNVPGGDARAAASALLLLVVLLMINSGALALGSRLQRRLVATA
ncbi:MAG: phosphate ABC transporter permease PstA [Acidobacteriota bacterium]